MRYLLLLLLTSTAIGQTTSVSGSGQSFIISGRPSVTTAQEANKAEAPLLVEYVEIAHPDNLELDLLRQEVQALRAELQKLKPSVQPVQKKTVSTQAVRMRWNIQGDWSPTEQETRNHLEKDHKVNTAGMTHQQMLDKHDALHSGRSITVSRAVQPVRTMQSCPGGVCPQPSQSGGRLRRLFR